MARWEFSFSFFSTFCPSTQTPLIPHKRKAFMPVTTSTHTPHIDQLDFTIQIERTIALDTPATLTRWYGTLEKAWRALKDAEASYIEWGHMDKATVCWHRALNVTRLIRETKLSRVRRTVKGLQVFK